MFAIGSYENLGRTVAIRRCRKAAWRFCAPFDVSLAIVPIAPGSPEETRTMAEVQSSDQLPSSEQVESPGGKIVPLMTANLDYSLNQIANEGTS